MLARKRCPRADELEALARKERVSSRVSKHVAGCDCCSQIVAHLRDEAQFIDELREAVTGLDDDTRAQLMEVCRKAVASAKGSKARPGRN